LFCFWGISFWDCGKFVIFAFDKNNADYGKGIQHIGYLRPETALYGGRYGKDESI
jgi:hypothetical protein